MASTREKQESQYQWGQCVLQGHGFFFPFTEKRMTRLHDLRKCVRHSIAYPGNWQVSIELYLNGHFPNLTRDQCDTICQNAELEWTIQPD